MNIKEALIIVVSGGHVVCDGSIELYFYPEDNCYMVTSYDDEMKGFISEQFDKVDDAVDFYLKDSSSV